MKKIIFCAICAIALNSCSSTETAIVFVPSMGKEIIVSDERLQHYSEGDSIQLSRMDHYEWAVETGPTAWKDELREFQFDSVAMTPPFRVDYRVGVIKKITD